MTNFDGKTFVVTGGESGIGRGTVEHLVFEGANVWIGGILEDEANQTLKATSVVRHR